MPAVPRGLFFEAIEAVVGRCHRIIPRESGRSLYLRPFVFGTEAGYMLRNSTTFRFMVIANPVEVYSSGPMRVAIERNDVRAAVGGVGDAKASANYAASLRASNAAVARGLTVALWLDAREQRFIQELSGMNCSRSSAASCTRRRSTARSCPASRAIRDQRWAGTWASRFTSAHGHR